MCDYSLTNVRSRPARVGDKLTVRDFGTGTRGFCAPEDPSTAVCLLPGTELSYSGEVMCLATGLFPWRERALDYTTAIFRQINKDKVAAHHDALEFPDGRSVLLTLLCEGQRATVLQLPAQPKTKNLRTKNESITSADRRKKDRRGGPPQIAGRPFFVHWGEELQFSGLRRELCRTAHSTFKLAALIIGHHLSASDF